MNYEYKCLKLNIAEPRVYVISDYVKSVQHVEGKIN